MKEHRSQFDKHIKVWKDDRIWDFTVNDTMYTTNIGITQPSLSIIQCTVFNSNDDDTLFFIYACGYSKYMLSRLLETRLSW